MEWYGRYSRICHSLLCSARYDIVSISLSISIIRTTDGLGGSPESSYSTL